MIDIRVRRHCMVWMDTNFGSVMSGAVIGGAGMYKKGEEWGHGMIGDVE